MLRPHFQNTLLVVLALVGLSIPAAHAQTYYTFQDLGTLGGNFTYGGGLNNAGQVVGSSENVNGQFHAFRTAPNSAINPATDDLGTLGGTFSWAYAIKDNGTVVGVAATTSGPGHAFLWQSGAPMRDLGTLGGPTSLAFSIASSNWVVGYSDPPGIVPKHAFLWRIVKLPEPPYQVAVMRDLGTLGGYESRANDINDAGQVVGWAHKASGQSRAFLWSDANGNGFSDPGEMQNLDTLGGSFSEANGINASGQVVGQAQVGGGLGHAFLWTTGVGMQDLGTLGGPDSSAQDINASGQIVGWSRTAVGGPVHAFISSGGVMRDLNALTVFPTGATWVLRGAIAINEGGQIVVAGKKDGQDRLFLLTPLTLTAITLTPSPVPGCKNVTGKVTLNGPAPTGGVTVTLTKAAGLTAATVPLTVKVLAGATSKSFQVTTAPVAIDQAGAVTAGYGGLTLSKSLTVRRMGVKSLTLNANPVKGGNSVTCTVTLECNAAPANITVTLSSNKTAVATVPPSLVIPFGIAGGTFPITTLPVAAAKQVTIKATANGISKSQTLTVNP